MLLDINYNPSQGRVKQLNAYHTLTPSPPLSYWVQCFWQLDVPAGRFYYRSIPDNSIDWILNLNDPQESFIITPFSSSIVFDLTGPVSFFGIRFRLFGYHGLISTPLGEWGAIANNAEPTEILADHVLHAVYESITKSIRFNERCKGIAKILLDNVKTPSIDIRLVRFIQYCFDNMASSISLSDKQSLEFGLSARQLRRLTQLHFGLTPRDFSRILRFQHVINIKGIGENTGVWSGHYYDQSHYIREFKHFSGLTPSEFKKLSVLYNHKSNL